MPRLGMRFDVDRIESGSYGIESWMVFFDAVDLISLAPALLYEGDSRASFAGHENVFIVAVETFDEPALEVVKRALSESPRFRQVCAAPMAVEGAAAAAEPLVLVGRIGADGEIVGDAWNARPALEAVRRQRAERG